MQGLDIFVFSLYLDIIIIVHSSFCCIIISVSINILFCQKIEASRSTSRFMSCVSFTRVPEVVSQVHPMEGQLCHWITETHSFHINKYVAAVLPSQSQLAGPFNFVMFWLEIGMRGFFISNKGIIFSVYCNSKTVWN